MDELTIFEHEVVVVQPMDDAFEDYLRIDVARGDASKDTVRGYKTQVKQWCIWCSNNGIDPASATTRDIKTYSRYLTESEYKATSIAHKLTIIRRFYAAAVDHGLRPDNPAAGVKPPKDDRAEDEFHYLTELQYSKLLDAVPRAKSEKNIRDKAIFAMMGLQALRTVEIERANVDDVTFSEEGASMLVRGKGHKRTIYLTPEVTALMKTYISARSHVRPDEKGVPLFTACGNRAGGKRISRRGIRQVVDFYLKKAEIKRPGVSGHALRHTGATLAYKYTNDIRGVQDMLGHQDPKTTARYTHVVDRRKNNPALAIPIPEAMHL